MIGWAIFCLTVIAFLVPNVATAVRLTATPNPVTFIGTKLGFTSDQFCVLRNPAPVGIQVDALQIVGGNQLDFTIVNPAAKTFLIPAKDSTTLLIRFRPQQTGARQSFLQLMTSDGELDIELDGTGLGTDPRIITRPSSIDFGLSTPGTVHDSVFYFIATGPDTAVITTFAISNFSGGLYFSAKLFDANRVLPIILAPGDSLKMIAEFAADQPLGSKTGAIEAQGEVSDSPFCLLRGNVGLPDILVSPASIDYGVKYRGSTTDTTVLITNPSALPLQIDDIQPLTYGWMLIAPLPQLPNTIAPGASLTLHLRFTPPDTGTFNYSLAIIAHATASGGNYRAVQLHAKVIDVPIVIESKHDLVYNCALDSVTIGGFTLADTSRGPVTISAIFLSDSLVGIREKLSFPLVLTAGETLDLHFTHLNNSDTHSVVIVRVLNGDVILRSDSFAVSIVHSALLVSQRFDPIDSLTLKTVGEVSIASDARGFRLHSIELDIESLASDAFTIDATAFTLNTQLVSGGSITNVRPTTAGAILTISVPNGIGWGGIQSSSNWLVRYNAKAFVAVKDTARVQATVSSPELAGCLDVVTDTQGVVIPKRCTDPLLRDKLADRPIMTNITVNPNPSSTGAASLRLVLASNATLRYSIVDATGTEARATTAILLLRGPANLPVDFSQMPSGSYYLLITAISPDGSRQRASLHLVLAR